MHARMHALLQLDDYDVMIGAIMDWGLENPVIFNCQLGIGRTTTGEVAGSQPGRRARSVPSGLTPTTACCAALHARVLSLPVCIHTCARSPAAASGVQCDSAARASLQLCPQGKQPRAPASPSPGWHLPLRVLGVQ